MRELSLLLFFLGFAGLVAVSLLEEPLRLMPSDVSEEYLGRRVKVCGDVRDLREKGGNTFFHLWDGKGSVFVVFFRKVDVGARACVCGIVQEYRGEIEVRGERLC